jgi:hypothetical protein
MNQATSKGVSQSLVQEAIFAASTKMNEALSATWDDNSIEPSSPYSLARVIDIDQQCDNNTTNLLRYRRMSGHIQRRCLDSNITTYSNTNTNNSVISLNDMNKTDENLFLSSPSSLGYKNSYKVDIIILTDANFNGIDKNLKEVKVDIKDTFGNCVTSLKSYSANIGEVDFHTWTY